MVCRFFTNVLRKLSRDRIILATNGARQLSNHMPATVITNTTPKPSAPILHYIQKLTQNLL